MKNFLETAIWSLIGMALFSIFIWLTFASFEASDKVTCKKLQNQAVEYKSANFYITSSEQKMCDDLELTVVAPVSDDGGVTFK